MSSVEPNSFCNQQASQKGEVYFPQTSTLHPAPPAKSPSYPHQQGQAPGMRERGRKRHGKEEGGSLLT